MSQRAASSLFLVLCLAAGQSVAGADPASTSAAPTITVSATGSVDYVPDTSRLSVGIRTEAATAQAAAAALNQQAQQVIAALRKAGISDRSMKTSGYNLEYREPPPPPSPVSPVPLRSEESVSPASAGEASVARRPVAAGRYVASEVLQVTVPVRSAGMVLDTAIGAGANESFGLSYQSSNADGLYRAALGRAVESARASAQAIAASAHVSIAGIQSISTVGEGSPVALADSFGAKRMAQAAVLPGTDSMTATVYIVFRIR
ncbi:MAG: hypothetical protein DLM53_01420 [Candidatus Eremiobacter antarcticus]|nr:SIMPL domain-containing protein [Candidatus Eremiobacteraeota bacterium]MBC5808065.1 SIMPL domain-containing protein [Candidatus Eremiobacteraeota bacterium]PZR63467.1 MAG: hypothetical protein DLM53_01420 [Candidatus Eremiobacter sp. RRmetagenome_bin22]